MKFKTVDNGICQECGKVVHVHEEDRGLKAAFVMCGDCFRKQAEGVAFVEKASK